MWNTFFTTSYQFDWNGNTKKHPLKGAEGNGPFAGRVKQLVDEDGLIKTKYGVDLGGRGNNSVFDFEDHLEAANGFSFKFHSNKGI